MIRERIKSTSAEVVIACSSEGCNGGGAPVKAVLEVSTGAELIDDLNLLKKEGWHIAESGSMCPACVKRSWGK